MVKKLGFKDKNILIFGRSIGSGPASYLASVRPCGGLILMSAFTSLRAVVGDLISNWAKGLIRERFNNLENIKKITCPVFLIHGQQDKLIN